MEKVLTECLSFFNPKSPANSKEQLFYNENATLFSPGTNAYEDSATLGQLVEADIILHILLSRKRIEEYVAAFSSAQLENRSVERNLFESLPYLEYEGKKIYLPCYDPETNAVLLSDLPSFKKSSANGERLSETNPSFVDPFSFYKGQVFSSLFSRLIKLDSVKDNLSFFYHPEFETLFLVDGEGKLLEELPLFDEKVKGIEKKDNLYPRLDELCLSYDEKNPDSFLNKAEELGFLSSPLVQEVQEKAKKAIKRQEREQNNKVYQSMKRMKKRIRKWQEAFGNWEENNPF
jgi:hypothetical protein